MNGTTHATAKGYMAHGTTHQSKGWYTRVAGLAPSPVTQEASHSGPLVTFGSWFVNHGWLSQLSSPELLPYKSIIKCTFWHDERKASHLASHKNQSPAQNRGLFTHVQLHPRLGRKLLGISAESFLVSLCMLLEERLRGDGTSTRVGAFRSIRICPPSHRTHTNDSYEHIDNTHEYWVAHTNDAHR